MGLYSPRSDSIKIYHSQNFSNHFILSFNMLFTLFLMDLWELFSSLRPYNFFLKVKIVYSMQPIKFLLLSMFIYPWPAPIWSCGSVVKQWKSNVIMESVALHFTLWWSIQKVDELKHSIMLYFCVSISNALLILILWILVLGEDGTCISKRSVSKTVKTCCKMLPSSFWQC